MSTHVGAVDLGLSVVSDPEWRSVRDDALRAVGVEPNWTPYAYPRIRANADAIADANVDANAYATSTPTANAIADVSADAFVDAIADVIAFAIADVIADANAYAIADAYADVIADAPLKGEHVRDGLYLFAMPSGNLTVLRVAWLKRIHGDEYEAHGQRTPLRRDYSVTFDKAQDKPPESWTWTEPISRPCPIHRLQILGPVPLSEKGYAKLFPRPKDWTEE